MFGAQLAEVTADVRERQKLTENGGVTLVQIFPGTSAADAQFKAGDVMRAVDGTSLTGIPMFLDRMSKSRAGDVLNIDLVRDAVRLEQRVTLREMPREKGEGCDVVYGSVISNGARLRAIITRPSAAGRHPAVMLLQGAHTCFAIDTPVGQPAVFTWIASDLTRHGYVTLRVERPACGDSEGGRGRDAVYGSGAGTSFEAVFEQRRRLASLDGTKPNEINREILDQARFWSALLIERKTPREIRGAHPELERLGWVVDGNYVGDRHYTFHYEVADKNFTDAWTKVAATRLATSTAAKSTHTRVLTMWGTSDWLVPFQL